MEHSPLQTQPTSTPQLEESIDEVLPPKWLKQAVYFFRWGLALFLGLNLLLGLGGCASSPSPTPWQSATQFFSREQLSAMLAANSSLGQVAPNSAQIDQIEAFAVQDTIVLNFNAPELCGATSRCLSAIYFKTAPTEPQWKAYLDVHLPPGLPLWGGTNQSLGNQPCLQLNQLGETTVKQYTLCYVDRQYKVTNQVDKPVQDKA